MPCLFGSADKLKVMVTHAALCAQHVQHLAQDLPFILAGDFNIQPDSSIYQLLKTGELPKHPLSVSEPGWSRGHTEDSPNGCGEIGGDHVPPVNTESDVAPLSRELHPQPHPHHPGIPSWLVNTLSDDSSSRDRRPEAWRTLVNDTCAKPQSTQNHVNTQWGGWSPSVSPMRSAQEVFHGAEPELTNHTRPKGQSDVFSGTLDYIWVSEHWRVERANRLPTRKELERGGVSSLPSELEPSDHLMLSAEVSLTSER